MSKIDLMEMENNPNYESEQEEQAKLKELYEKQEKQKKIKEAINLLYENGFVVKKRDKS